MIGAILKGIPLLNGVVKTIFGDKSKREQNKHVQTMSSHDEKMAVYQQFAKEFGHSKTAWDSFIDGINRIPRPFMTFGVIWLFYHCWSDPISFLEGVTALQAMPQEGWWILGIIITFWFGGKMQKDFGKIKNIKEIPAIIDRVTEIKHLSKKKKDDSLPWLSDGHNEGISFEERVKNRYKN